MAKRLLKHGGAKCPNSKCTYRWFWDWESDSYINQFGESAIELPITLSGPFLDQHKVKHIERDKQITLSHCLCGIGTVLDVLVVDEMGGFNYNHPDWKNVDWEQEEYSWYGPGGPPK